MHDAKKLVCLLLALTTLALHATEMEISRWLDGDGRIWQATPDEFMAEYGPSGFRWVSAVNRQSARSINPELTAFGRRVYEVIARFTPTTLTGLAISIYNQGDAGHLSEDALKKLVDTVSKAISAGLGIEPERVRRSNRGRSTMYLREWNHTAHKLGLVWSYTDEYREQGRVVPYRSEYVTLRIIPAAAGALAAVGREAVTAREVSNKELAARVVTKDNGDLYIDRLPMVDQGSKGYCSVASAERVLRYYGMQVDQHELAQIAKSSAAAGTNSETMLDALKQIGAKFGVRLRIHNDFDARDFTRLVRSYNSLARKARRPEIEMDRRMIVVNDIYRQMQFDILRESRLSPSSYINRFADDIRNYSKRGIPLFWSVIVGLAPETPAITGSGGHMRLLIGFNDQTDEVLYSDSWGNGHELKRMPLADAWAITTGCFTLEPRNSRQ